MAERKLREGWCSLVEELMGKVLFRSLRYNFKRQRLPSRENVHHILFLGGSALVDPSFNQDLSHRFHLNKTTNYIPSGPEGRVRPATHPSHELFNTIDWAPTKLSTDCNIKGAAVTIAAVVEVTIQLGIQALRNHYKLERHTQSATAWKHIKGVLTIGHRQFFKSITSIWNQPRKFLQTCHPLL